MRPITPGDVLTRFAPAPTGYLHLGHVVNAIYVWGVARALGGRILLRIEDHDLKRSRQEYGAAILEDLAWLGFSADQPLVRQSERNAIYSEALDGLRARGLIYACECSRAEVAAHAGAMADGGEICYPGTCRDKRVPEKPGLGLRVRLAAGTERFEDWTRGPQEQRPHAQCGDVLVRDRDGFWTYQFAAAVDDFEQGVTLVIRGDDLLASTGRQLQMARLLGRAEPLAFLHHPLVMKTSGQKLSKSDGDTGLRELRARGWRAEQVIGHAAALAGLIESERLMDANDVSALFRTLARDRASVSS